MPTANKDAATSERARGERARGERARGESSTDNSIEEIDEVLLAGSSSDYSGVNPSPSQALLVLRPSVAHTKVSGYVIDSRLHCH